MLLTWRFVPIFILGFWHHESSDPSRPRKRLRKRWNKIGFIYKSRIETNLIFCSVKEDTFSVKILFIWKLMITCVQSYLQKCSKIDPSHPMLQYWNTALLFFYRKDSPLSVIRVKVKNKDRFSLVLCVNRSKKEEFWKYIWLVCFSIILKFFFFCLAVHGKKFFSSAI